MQVQIRHFDAVMVLTKILSENEMEIINDALQCYGRHPEEHSYNEEINDIRAIAEAFSLCGYNRVLPKYDILHPPESSG